MTTTTQETQDSIVTSTGDKPLNHNSQVDWYSVHLYVQPRLTPVERWPLVGTLAWQQLDDGDPAKRAALFDAAQHWALSLETRQESMAAAGRAISEAADWKTIANRLANRSTVYIPRVKEPV